MLRPSSQFLPPMLQLHKHSDIFLYEHMELIIEVGGISHINPKWEILCKRCVCVMREKQGKWFCVGLFPEKTCSVFVSSIDIFVSQAALD